MLKSGSTVFAALLFAGCAGMSAAPAGGGPGAARVTGTLNHPAEGGGGGRTFSLKGLDNASYYWLDPADRSAYLNYAGCGNTLDAGHPAARALILDCLRYWAQEMHVDGFRFDLATVLARRDQGFEPDNALFGAIRSDPVLAYAKMIAEPWDLGPGGYWLGGFSDRLVRVE